MNESAEHSTSGREKPEKDTMKRIEEEALERICTDTQTMRSIFATSSEPLHFYNVAIIGNPPDDVLFAEMEALFDPALTRLHYFFFDRLEWRGHRLKNGFRIESDPHDQCFLSEKVNTVLLFEETGNRYEREEQLAKRAGKLVIRISAEESKTNQDTTSNL